MDKSQKDECLDRIALVLRAGHRYNIRLEHASQTADDVAVWEQKYREASRIGEDAARSYADAETVCHIIDSYFS